MDKKQAWTIADRIALKLSKDKLLSGHLSPVKKIIEDEIKLLHVHEEKAAAKDMTDAELRAELRDFLITKLQDKTLSGSDIGQLKDVFGLADQTTDLIINTVDYKNAIIECWRCHANVHAPIEEPIEKTQAIREENTKASQAKKE
jgi:hypothetical protein